jgi:outer membrane beta-barrel protein
LFAGIQAYAAETEQVINPEIDRRDIKDAAIDTENFEFGLFAGVMNVEDFGTNPVYGARLAYHVTEDLFAEVSYGQTETSETSFERLSGNIQLLSDDDRKLIYLNASAGFNILPGEGFIGSKWAFTSALYVIGGVGGTRFASDDALSWNIGAGYRVLVNDWLSLRIDVRDHIFELDLLGQRQTNHNLEFTGGLSIFF